MGTKNLWLPIVMAAVILVLGWQLPLRGATTPTTPAQNGASCITGGSVQDGNYAYGIGQLCIADLDGDGRQEIIITPVFIKAGTTQRVVIIDNNGKIRSNTSLP